MSGEPVWLASVSLRRKGRIKATGDWTRRQFLDAEACVNHALVGAGNNNRERAFRMNITFCVHRALSEDEQARLPSSWQDAVGGLAGPPVEILWSRGIEHTLASMPCRSPLWLVVDANRPDLRVPEGCGACDVCRAREAAVERGRREIKKNTSRA